MENSVIYDKDFHGLFAELYDSLFHGDIILSKTVPMFKCHENRFNKNFETMLHSTTYQKSLEYCNRFSKQTKCFIEMHFAHYVVVKSFCLISLSGEDGKYLSYVKSINKQQQLFNSKRDVRYQPYLLNLSASRNVSVLDVIYSYVSALKYFDCAKTKDEKNLGINLVDFIVPIFTKLIDSMQLIIISNGLKDAKYSASVRYFRFLTVFVQQLLSSRIDFYSQLGEYEKILELLDHKLAMKAKWLITKLEDNEDFTLYFYQSKTSSFEESKRLIDFQKGIACKKLHRHHEAIQHFLQSCDSNMEEAGSLVCAGIGRCYLYLKQYPLSLDWLNSAITKLNNEIKAKRLGRLSFGAVELTLEKVFRSKFHLLVRMNKITEAKDLVLFYEREMRLSCKKKMSISFNRGYCAVKERNLKEAQEYFNLGIANQEEWDTFPVVAAYVQTLIMCYQHTFARNFLNDLVASGKYKEDESFTDHLENLNKAITFHETKTEQEFLLEERKEDMSESATEEVNDVDTYIVGEKINEEVRNDCSVSVSTVFDLDSVD